MLNLSWSLQLALVEMLAQEDRAVFLISHFVVDEHYDSKPFCFLVINNSQDSGDIACNLSCQIIVTDFKGEQN